MNAAKSSKYADPFLDILQLHFPTDMRKNLVDPEMQTMFDTFDFPKLSNSDIQIITTRLADGLSYNDSVQDIVFQFPFRPSALQTIVNKCHQDGSKRAQFATYFILYSYVSFCLIIEKNSTFGHLPALLSSLNTIIHVTPLAVKAFIRLISFYSIKRDFVQIKLFIPPITDFFKNANFENIVAFDIFVDLFDGLTNNGQTNVQEDAHELYTLVSAMAEERADVFPQEAAIKIMESLKHLVIEMDFHVLDMAAHMGPLLGHEYVSKLSKIMIPVIINRIINEAMTITIDLPNSDKTNSNCDFNNTQEIINDTNNMNDNANNNMNNDLNEGDETKKLKKGENSKSYSNVKLDKPEQILKPVLEFKDINTFPDGFNVISHERLPERDEIINLCKPDIFVKHLGLFLKVVGHYEESTATFLDTFQDSISISIKNKHFFSMMAYFLQSGLELSRVSKLPQMVRFLFSDLLFEPSMICTIEDTSTHKLNSLRSAAFQLILNEGPDALNSVLIESMQHPQLYAELIHRCLVNRSIIISILPQSKKLLQTIITSTLYYQSYAFQGNKSVDTVRLAIFLFYSSVFNDRNVEDFIFHNDYFISSFLSFLFEEPVRPLITTQLKAYLARDNIQVTPMIGEEITKTLEIASRELPSLRSIKLANDIMTTIIDALSHQYLRYLIFMPTIGPMIRSLPFLTSTPECENFVLFTLQFFAIIARDYSLSEMQLALIEGAISRVFSNNPPKLVFVRLIQIMAADNFLSVSPMFLIRQPLALPVFFRVFLQTLRYGEVINFIYDLCNYAATNAFACHYCKLDRSLLESLQPNWYDKDVDVNKVELILKLFSRIAYSISSPDIVSLFISLLSPLKDKYLPVCFDMILSTLNTIVSSTLKCPETSIPLPQTPISMEKLIDITQGFTFVAWIEMESISPQYKPNLFTFSDGVESFLKLSLSSNIIVPFQRTPKNESTARADKEIPLSQWSFVTISYILEDGMVNIIVSVNCHDSRRLQFPQFEFSTGNNKLVNFSFFGVNQDSVQPDIPVLIGPFALFPNLDSSTITQLFGHGPRQLNRVPIQPYFTYIPQSNQTSNETTSTFLNVLTKNCKLTILLPLFSLIDYKTVNGVYFKNITDTTIEILSNSLLMSDATEIEFAKLHGFEILSDLLLATDFSLLNYSTYLRFFSLLQLLRTGVLQQQLLRCIIGNLNIWIVTDADNHLRILKHWARVLFLTNSPTDSFATFLTNTVLYYWDSPHKREYLKGTKESARPRPENLNVVECRQYMTDILLMMSQKNFTNDDFNLLISYIRRCPDKGTVLSLVNLILLMAKTVPSPLMVAVANEEFHSLIHQLFYRKWPDMTRMLIEIICMLHVNKILVPPHRPTFEEHIEIIIHDLTINVITQENLDYFSRKLLPSIPQLLPLCIWMAYNISDSAITKLISETKPSESYVINERWAKWPIIVASQTNDSISASIFIFLAKCGHKEWFNLYSMIIIIGKAFKKDSSLMLGIYLTYLSNCLLCNSILPTHENLASFFELVRHFLFFRDSKEKQKELEAAFRFSPFYEATSSKSETTKFKARTRSLIPTGLLSSRTLFDECKRPFVKAEMLLENINAINHLPQLYDFGVRLDERLRWSDFVLAQNTIHLVGSTGYSPALDIDLIICTLVLRMHPTIVQDHIRTLKLTPKMISTNQMYIDLLCYKAMRLGISIEFVQFKSKKFAENASKALFETSKWQMEKFVEYPKQILTSLKMFDTEFNETTDLIVLNVEKTYDCFMYSMKRTLSDKTTEAFENGKLWRQLWDSITSHGSFWEMAAVEKPSPMRDSLGCYCDCPSRTKNRVHKRKNIPSIRPEFSATCELILNLKSIPLEFEMFYDRIELSYENNKRKVISFYEIYEIVPRSRFHQNNSIEIFLFDHHSYFLSFSVDKKSNKITSESIIKYINEHEPRLSTPIINLEKLTEQWANREITNFEYLLALNKLSGRSFNDSTQYPIFPWIIKDYNSETFKLNDASLYRDLARPIGTFNDERIKKLRTFAEDHKTATNFGYLYPSAPSTSSSVISFLGNMPPFSESITNDRKLTSVPETFKDVTSEKDDFRELIPEFYFEPEIFQPNVELPPWAKSPIEFVYLNRKALESDNTSLTLNHWIDLIWGCNSRGREAVKIENTYRHELYDTVWDNFKDKCTESKDNSLSLNDSDNDFTFKLDGKNHNHQNNNKSNENNILSKEDIIAIMNENGLMPKQLFTCKHPQRILLETNSKRITEPIIIDATSNSIAFANIKAIPSQNQIVFLYIDAAGILKKDTVTFNITAKEISLDDFSSPNSPNVKISYNNNYNNNHNYNYSNIANKNTNNLPPTPKRSNTGNINTNPLNNNYLNYSNQKLNHINNGSTNNFYSNSRTSSSSTNVSSPTSNSSLNNLNNVILSSSMNNNMSLTNCCIESIRSVETTMINIDGFNSVSDNTQFAYINDDYVLTSNETSTSLLNVKEMICQPFLTDPSVCLAASYPYFLTLTSEFLINIYHNDNKVAPKFIIPYMRTAATCAALSNVFHMAVVGLSEEILIYSISQKTLTRRIKLENIEPKIISISPSWGFIVIYGKTIVKDRNCQNKGEIDGNNHEQDNVLLTLSVNGEVIRRTVLPSEITIMTTFKSIGCFDFVAFANEKGKVFICEAFFLDIPTIPFVKCQHGVREMAYCEQFQMMVIVTVNGSFFFQPLVTNDLVTLSNGH
ncbi:hypothetical protein TRFO_06490 [Tritrichomonas foetus]|uniref:Beige/BEACH domain containing protein n=1 Tax=Tritrichomonas foetus TaxID=1144522 RepID=A0A1J4K0A4_9EUKA|nr:hypothetical protein TRFO_06490 [Tritrichomonas foetus]|eukprot:OHT04160.1 hypothetical protein TRFO_06490 [Tritrichomonas foetus]